MRTSSVQLGGTVIVSEYAPDTLSDADGMGGTDPHPPHNIAFRTMDMTTCLNPLAIS